VIAIMAKGDERIVRNMSFNHYHIKKKLVRRKSTGSLLANSNQKTTDKSDDQLVFSAFSAFPSHQLLDTALSILQLGGCTTTNSTSIKPVKTVDTTHKQDDQSHRFSDTNNSNIKNINNNNEQYSDVSLDSGLHLSVHDDDDEEGDDFNISKSAVMSSSPKSINRPHHKMDSSGNLLLSDEATSTSSATDSGSVTSDLSGGHSGGGDYDEQDGGGCWDSSDFSDYDDYAEHFVSYEFDDYPESVFCDSNDSSSCSNSSSSSSDNTTAESDNRSYYRPSVSPHRRRRSSILNPAEVYVADKHGYDCACVCGGDGAVDQQQQPNRVKRANSIKSRL